MEEAERRIEQLMELRREEQVSTAFSVDALSCCLLKHLLKLASALQENVKSALNLTKSVEATRAHLQAEVRNKETENNHLTAQLQVQKPHG